MVSRLALQTTKTRLQILGSWILPLAMDRIGKPAIALQPSRTWCALAVAASAGMLTVRWHLKDCTRTATRRIASRRHVQQAEKGSE